MDNLRIDYDDWQSKTKPHGISACIRVRNESQFMAAAVRSVIDLVDEVVLCIQPSEDNTLEVAADLRAQYPDKVRLVFYPLVPAWIDTPEFYEGDPDQPGHLVHMSNWALSQCRYSWILKIEGDVIALPTLRSMIEHVLEDNRPVYYGLVILNVAGADMNKVSWENPRNGGWDEAIFPNNPQLARFYRSGKWEVVQARLPHHCLGWALLHMKRCKAGKDQGWDGEHYVDWTPENVEAALSNYADEHEGLYPGPDHPFGKHILFGDEWKKYL
jgi:glycosyltransferase involved in cell wall biosynthesis